MQTVEILFQSASKNHGQTLSSWQVRELAKFITGIDNMLAAYVNEYGPNLLLTLTGQDDIVEAEIIEDDQGEGEVIEDADLVGDKSSEGGNEDDAQTIPEESGQDSNGTGLDSSSQEEK